MAKWGRFHLLLHTGVDQLEKAGGGDLVTYLSGGGEEEGRRGDVRRGRGDMGRRGEGGEGRKEGCTRGRRDVATPG